MGPIWIRAEPSEGATLSKRKILLALESTQRFVCMLKSDRREKIKSPRTYARRIAVGVESETLIVQRLGRELE